MTDAERKTPREIAGELIAESVGRKWYNSIDGYHDKEIILFNRIVSLINSEREKIKQLEAENLVMREALELIQITLATSLEERDRQLSRVILSVDELNKALDNRERVYKERRGIFNELHRILSHLGRKTS